MKNYQVTIANVTDRTALPRTIIAPDSVAAIRVALNMLPTNVRRDQPLIVVVHPVPAPALEAVAA